jgi:alpha-N-arabinofuranosidase
LAAAAGRAEPPSFTPAPPSPGTFANPILPGFYPDPSVERVGDDYYLVTSSFEMFPGVPIFHSRDLVSWRQIGHVLDRPSQLPLDGVGASDGIYAPTIRHHRGTFYMVTTLVTRLPKDKYTNFLVTAKNPAGPWSEPRVLSETFWRIDPSLFFDDDGKAYYVGNRLADPSPYKGHRIISLQQLDLKTMKLVGPVHDLGQGHAREAFAPEAPHVYKKDGYYYLLVAEGGTFATHSVTISRSKALTGPYEQAQQNPILTHRHLGPGADIHSVGHAELVQTPKGAWWMFALGMRGAGGFCCTLGRETFLVPVRWDAGGWPLVNPGVGRIRALEPRPELPPAPAPTEPACDHFDGERLGFAWNFVRTPAAPFWSLTKRPGHLQVSLKKETLGEPANPAFVGRRLQHADFSVRTKLEFTPQAEHEAAGIAVRNGNNFLRVVKTRRGNAQVLRVVRHDAGKEQVLAEAAAPPGPLYLKLEARREIDYAVAFATSPERWTPLGGRIDARLLAHDKAPGGQFTGSYVGVYASSHGRPSGNTADFDYLEYKGD